MIDLMGPEPRGSGTPEALLGETSATYWFPGDALSASIKLFRFEMGLVPVAWGRWVMTWNPLGIGASGVRLVHMDAGPSNITQIAEFTGYYNVTPIVGAVDITATLNSLRTGGQYKFIGHQLRSNGITQAPLVYSSALEIVWDLG